MSDKPFKLTMIRYGVRRQFEYDTLAGAVRFALGCVEENTAAPERLSESGVVIWKQEGTGPDSISDSLDALRALLPEEQPALPSDQAHLRMAQEEAWLVLRVRDWAKRANRIAPLPDLRAAEQAFALDLQRDDGNRPREGSQTEERVGEQQPRRPE